MPRRIAALLVAFVTLFPTAPASAYVGPGDDRQRTESTAWWFYTGVTQPWISEFATKNNARITDIHVESTVAPFRYSVVFVRNTGAYATGWWWYTNVTPTRATELATQNKARIVKAHVYDTSAGRKATVVMVSNTGTNAEAWWWWIGSIQTISTKLAETQARIVSLNAIGGGTYAAVTTRNTGNDATGWWWYVNATTGSISSHLTANHARVVDLDRNADGTFNVVMYSNPSTRWFWYVNASPTWLRDKATAEKQRIIDFRTYTRDGVRSAAAVMTSNTGASTAPAPMGVAPRGPGGPSSPAAPVATGEVAGTESPSAAPDGLAPSDDPAAFATEEPTPTTSPIVIGTGGSTGIPLLPVAALGAAVLVVGGAVAAARRSRRDAG